VTPDTERSTPAGEQVFEWHPEYQGRRLDEVTRDLATDIERDQRAYELALTGAEESEHDALASVVDVERRWSPYDFGWHESDPRDLARRIAAFEWEREQRNEMFSWQEYRNVGSSAGPAAATGSDWRASMSDEQRRTVANGLAVLIVGLIVVAVAVVLIVVL
jgi:hypothetical protein